MYLLLLQGSSSRICPYLGSQPVPLSTLVFFLSFLTSYFCMHDFNNLTLSKEYQGKRSLHFSWSQLLILKVNSGMLPHQRGVLWSPCANETFCPIINDKNSLYLYAVYYNLLVHVFLCAVEIINSSPALFTSLPLISLLWYWGLHSGAFTVNYVPSHLKLGFS